MTTGPEQHPLADRLAYGPTDAAKVMSVSRAPVFEWIRQGKVRSVKIGGRTLIPWEELLCLLSGATFSDSTPARLER